ncbi:MAG: glycosyltransferase [Gemmatimonadaceae bacterium]
MIASHPLAFALALLAVLPIFVVVWRFRRTVSLDAYALHTGADAPLVSVIIPARDEAHNIERCVRSVLAGAYHALEVIVVDDHSTDGTGAIVRRIASEPASAGRVRLIDAPTLPVGWFGKQWACHTGAAVARGTLLCFTDADTAHGPELLARSVTALEQRGASLFTIAGRQEMGSFWEKVVQPVVFSVMLSRYGGLETMSESTDPIHKIANGQFILVRRDHYDRLGGHESVRGHVAEDLRLAQRFTEAGLGAHMVLARSHMRTRMYTSLGEIRRGWGKNIFAAGRDTLRLGPVGRRVLPWIFPIPALLPVIPVLILALAIAGVLGEGALLFGAVVTGASLLYWIGVYGFAQLSPLWALTYPLGCLVFAGICAEAAIRGTRVGWKGRTYDMVD